MAACSIADEEIVAGAARTTLNDLAVWTAEADKVLVF
jgi:sulfur relay (sulfurtransferase) complex TusBCD TusD component (DsrE family)